MKLLAIVSLLCLLLGVKCQSPRKLPKGNTSPLNETPTPSNNNPPEQVPVNPSPVNPSPVIIVPTSIAPVISTSILISSTLTTSSTPTPVSTSPSATSAILPTSTGSSTNTAGAATKTNSANDNSRIVIDDTHSTDAGSLPSINSNSSPNETLPAWAIAIIVVGVLLLVSLAAFITYRYLKQSNRVDIDPDRSFETSKTLPSRWQNAIWNQRMVPMKYKCSAPTTSENSEETLAQAIGHDGLEKTVMCKTQETSAVDNPSLHLLSVKTAASVSIQVEDPKDVPDAFLSNSSFLNEPNAISPSTCSTKVGIIQKSVNPSSSSDPPENDKLLPRVNLPELVPKKAAKIALSTSVPHSTSHLQAADCNNSWTLSDQMMSPPVGDPFSIKTYSWGSNSGALDSSDVSEDTCLPFSSVSTVGSFLSPGSTFVVGKRLKYSSLLPLMAQHTSKHAPLDLWVGETVQIVQDLQNGLLVARTPNGHVGLMPTDVLVKW